VRGNAGVGEGELGGADGALDWFADQAGTCLIRKIAESSSR
jgi:hypothetical protein